ncbi:zinc finger BED domain-containing protein RICESLEEPER 2-like [Pistacia vera]|uniref:zinc finger BED domain-containing protein RICESLEEPER 2-like n=1 Tax=Pistacia vera TaxID=55513 RepID=UPI001263D55A|nr:zinc finger BED domain-containing protein RICESLEEPER 2-like [Pistacia vera]
MAVGSGLPPLIGGKFEIARMRELVAQWVLMHEHPFKVIEQAGFNNLLRYASPGWEKISHVTSKYDCMKVYEMEKKKLKAVLKNIDRISLTTDLWNSSNQKLEYMVLMGHWIDTNWRLNKRVLSFVRLKPPRGGVQIADSVFNCLREWGIENKVFTISVDNASSNDLAIKVLKENFSITKKLLCGGKLFHVRCCAHILNIMVQDGLSQIRHIIKDVRDSVYYINQSESRLQIFSEIVQQLQLPHRKLILDCKTRWNSTYEMLATALKFQSVFPRYSERDQHFTSCPLEEDWVKIQKVCEILKVFNVTTNIISGSEYPTSNKFLAELCKVKVLLDKHAEDENEFLRTMVTKMKGKFDKCWGECNLLIAIAAVLDPRCKMRVLDYAFPKIYGDLDARVHSTTVRDALYELYREYVTTSQSSADQHMPATRQGKGRGSGSGTNVDDDSSGWLDLMNYVDVIETTASEKSELDSYFEEPCYKCQVDYETFDALKWWQANSLKYPVLCKVARDILAVPISTVASEATFSTGSRVIDNY